MEAIAEETGVNSPSADAEFGAARGTDVLVDPRTGADYVVVPEGATMAHDGSLLPVSTRKEFKKALKERAAFLAFLTKTRKDPRWRATRIRRRRKVFRDVDQNVYRNVQKSLRQVSSRGRRARSSRWRTSPTGPRRT
jgi:hypothetical protein